MKSRVIRALIFSFLLFQCFLTLSFAQSATVEALNKLYNDYPQEKIYLWYNKSEYVAGETIWFKGYVFSGYDIFHLSTTLYVELYDADKKIVDTRLFPLYYGATQGSIELEDKLAEGVYYIRAYTRWMLNFDEAFQYIHPIPVFNPASSKHLKLKTTKWEARAFPEGGNLINDVETKVAVRFFSPSPLPENWGGYLYDESKPIEKIKEFKSLDKNVGIFSFTPETGKKYFVFVQDENGNSQHCALPYVKNSGVALAIKEVSDSVSYKLSFQNIPGNANDYSIVGQIQHQLIYYAKYKSSENQLNLKIPLITNSNGILHLTIFNPLNEPVAERLVFINHSKLIFDSLVLDQFNSSFEPRSKNEIILKVDSINWTSYAISVTDAETTSSLKEENMLSTLWLTSDLKNPIQSPASYFISSDIKKTEALDAILISENWSRFNWNDLLNNKYPVIKYKPHFYLSYTGTIKRGAKIKPGDEVNLMFSFPDSSFHVTVAKIDSIRNINLENLAFTEDLKVYYQLNNKKSNARSIEIEFVKNNRFEPYYLPLPENLYNLTIPSEKTVTPSWVNRSLNTMKLERSSDDIYKTLDEVTVRSKLRVAKDQLNEKLSSPMYRSIDETVFDFINEQQNAYSYTNILNWLQGRVAGLNIQMNNEGVLVPYIRGFLVSVVVDEMVVQADYLNSLSIADIAMIKVIKGFVPGLPMGGGGGVVAIYTARGNLRPPQTELNFPNTTIKGYDEVKKVFQPDYADKTKSNKNADTRDQLLWQYLLPPEKGIDKSLVSFFNNDNTKSYRVIVQGYNDNGIPVYFEKIIGPSSTPF